MNRIFRTLWSHSLQAWVVTSELAKSGGKRGGGRAAGVLLLAPLGALAANLPSGGTVVSGSGSLSSSGHQLTVEQSSANLAIDWQSFDIGTGHGVTFHQPSSQAVALNRVVGQDASRLLGNLDANGRVFLVNPNGILFGQGASVNVGGLVASTLDISNSDFEQGRYHFKSQTTPKAVINQGSLTAKNGGAVALLGGQVSNQGVIVANGGSVALAAGQAMTLDFAGDGLLSVKVDEATADALAENRELIRANGGQVLLTAHASDALLKTVVNNSGVIEAQTVAERGGKIELLGGFDGGTVQVAGTLDASAPKGGNGGFIETSGAHVQVADGAKLTTKATQGKSGTWLLDPTDFTVSTGSSAATASGIGASTLAANLQNGNVTLQTISSGSDTGKLSVDSAVSWSADTTLTLNAHGDLSLNAPLTATGTSAGLTLNYGGYIQNSGNVTAGSDYHVNAPVTLSGSNANLSINGQTYTLLHSLSDLQSRVDPTGNFALVADVDAQNSTYGAPLIATTPSSEFQGSFAGLGHTISNLTINSGNNYVGMFGYLGAATLRDFGLVNATVSGSTYVGALAGTSRAAISNVYASGSVRGTSRVGGLIGQNTGSVNASYASSNVSGGGDTGGLIGYSEGSLTNVYATGNVSDTGTNSAFGGLVGWLRSGTVSGAYATGNVTGGETVGGLIGYNLDSQVDRVYATGSLTGGAGASAVGGLVGFHRGNSTLSNGYWDGSSTGRGSAVGYAMGGASSSNIGNLASGDRYAHTSYGTLGTWSAVAGTNGVYVAKDVSGNPAWIMLEGQTRPFLASEYSNRVGNAHQLQLMAYNLAANYTVANDIDARQTAGSTASGMWSSAGFSPVGNDTTAFTGSLNGHNPLTSGRQKIIGLTIARGNQNYVGLFGSIAATSRISNLALTDASVSGGAYVGGVAGFNAGTLSNITVRGSVNSTGDFVGGLVGHNNAGSISNAFTSGSTGGSGGPYSGNYVGGLIGANNNGTVSDAFSTSTVSGGDSVGGLVGNDFQGRYTNVHTSGSVTSTSNAGGNYAGGLIGITSGSSIQNASASGDVTATTTHAGGLIGQASSATLSYVRASGNVSGTSDIGGLVGLTYNGSITNGSASGSASGTINVGGLVGYAYRIRISDAYAVGDVSGSSDIGGLVGFSDEGVLTRVYATGFVAGTDNAGGLVGYNYRGTVNAAYAMGGVIGTEYLGGLVGYNDAGTINASYATGDVGGNNDVGGLVGSNAGTINASFFATDFGGNPINDGLSLAGSNTGSIDASSGDRTWAALNTLSTFTDAGWAIDDLGGTGKTWRLYEHMGTPLLRTFLTPLTINTSLSGLDKTYDRTAVNGTTMSYTMDSNTDPSLLVGSLLHYATIGNGAGRYTTGNGNLQVNGLASLQQGYDISYMVNGGITITPKSITGAITAQDKTYDGTTNATTAGTLSGVVSGDTVDFTTSGSFIDKNVGTGRQVNVSGVISGTGAGNYVLGSTNATTTANIAAKSITGSITAQDKTYDGTTNATTAGILNGVLGNDVVSFATNGRFTDKNVGNGKTVNTSGNLSGNDAGNYQLTTNATTTADITPASLVITAEDASKVAGQLAQLSGYSVMGLFTGDAVAQVTLASPGANASAAAGDYLIVPSTASGLGLGNYLISYRTGTLQVQGATAPQPVVDNSSTQPTTSPTVSVTPPVLAAQVSSTVSVQERQTKNAQTVNNSPLRLPPLDVQRSNSLSGLSSLDIINRGIRLPEGI